VKEEFTQQNNLVFLYKGAICYFANFFEQLKAKEQ